MSIKKQKGLTLLETVLAIATLLIVLPILFLSLVRLNKESAYFNVRQRMDNSLSLILADLSSELSAAQSLAVTTSTWGGNPSSFSFVDQDGNMVIIDCQTTTVALPGGDQTISRLRLQRGTLENVWLTDYDVDVTSWVAQVVRDSGSNLTGIRLQVTLAMANKNNVPFQDAESSIDFTIALPPSVQSL